ncbi:hypothetical protein NL676_021045 [Syzygium grande]|nr:hypothetical protein NL676_021045 [Syzygium grande]
MQRPELLSSKEALTRASLRFPYGNARRATIRASRLPASHRTFESLRRQRSGGGSRGLAQFFGEYERTCSQRHFSINK